MPKSAASIIWIVLFGISIAILTLWPVPIHIGLEELAEACLGIPVAIGMTKGDGRWDGGRLRWVVKRIYEYGKENYPGMDIREENLYRLFMDLDIRKGDRVFELGPGRSILAVGAALLGADVTVVEHPDTLKEYGDKAGIVAMMRDFGDEIKQAGGSISLIEGDITKKGIVNRLRRLVKEEGLFNYIFAIDVLFPEGDPSILKPLAGIRGKKRVRKVIKSLTGLIDSRNGTFYLSNAVSVSVRGHKMKIDGLEEELQKLGPFEYTWAPIPPHKAEVGLIYRLSSYKDKSFLKKIIRIVKSWFRRDKEDGVKPDIQEKVSEPERMDYQIGDLERSSFDSLKVFILDRLQGEGEERLHLDRERIDEMINQMCVYVEREIGLSNIKEGVMERLPESLVLNIYNISHCLFPREEGLGVNRNALLTLQEIGVESNIIELLIVIGIFFNQIIREGYKKEIGYRNKKMRFDLNEMLIKDYKIDLLNMNYGLLLLKECMDIFNMPPDDIKKMKTLLDHIFPYEIEKDKRDIQKRAMVLVLKLIEDGAVPKDSRVITKAVSYFRQFFREVPYSRKWHPESVVRMFYLPGAVLVRRNIRVNDLVILNRRYMEFIKSKEYWLGISEEEIINLIEESLSNAQYREGDNLIYRKSPEDPYFYVVMLKNGIIRSFRKVEAREDMIKVFFKIIEESLKSVKPKGLIILEEEQMGHGLKLFIDILIKKGLDIVGIKVGLVSSGDLDKDRIEKELGIKNIFIGRDLDSIINQADETNIVYLGDFDNKKAGGLKKKGIKLIKSGNAGLPLEFLMAVKLLEVDNYEEIKDIYERFLDCLIEQDLITEKEKQLILRDVRRFGYIVLPRVQKILDIWNELQKFGSSVDICV